MICIRRMKKMRSIVKILKTQDTGDMGIGAMIVFIAMVLVAGIAASVLIQTANRLEIQAMTTGQETTNEVATGIGVESITGAKTGEFNVSGYTGGDGDWANGTIANVTITVSPRAGSKDIDLSNAVIEVSDSANKIVLEWNTSAWFLNPDANGLFATDGFGGTPKEFGVIVIEDADDSCTSTNPVINRGDHVVLTFSAAKAFPASDGGSGWHERTDIWGMIIPEDGATGIFAFRTPASFADTIFDLY
jgi:archaeal flagellin FlaB